MLVCVFYSINVFVAYFKVVDRCITVEVALIIAVVCFTSLVSFALLKNT